MEKTICTYCKKEMDCPEKMLAAKVNICNNCIENISEKNINNPNFTNFLKDIENQVGDIGKKFDKCNK